MDHADCIMCVSELNTSNGYQSISPRSKKGIYCAQCSLSLSEEIQAIPRPNHKGKDKIVTFLGRITMQKGPEYFVEAASNGVAQNSKC